MKAKKIRLLFIILVMPIFWAVPCILLARGPHLYTYSVRPGDTLSEITLIFTGNLNYYRIARDNNIQNPDLIFPGDKITLSCARPLHTLRTYLEAIYDHESRTAYNLLSRDTREKFTFEEFKDSLGTTTFYDLNSLDVCADFIKEYKHILQIKAFLYQDPASWGFNLVRERYKWQIFLSSLNPTFPLDNETIGWKCK
jgi:hypothetical protein